MASDSKTVRQIRQCHPNLRRDMIVSHSLPNLDIDAGELATGAEDATIKGNVKQVDELCLWRIISRPLHSNASASGV